MLFHFLQKLNNYLFLPRLNSGRVICQEHLKGRYDLEVIDLSQHPELAEAAQIIAAPTLIKKLPLPLRRFIGDMSETERILIGLDLRRSIDTATEAGSR